MSEHHEQVAVVDWFRLAYPEYSGCLFSIPNGAYLAGHIGARKKQLEKLKKEGLKPGVSDLFLMIAAHDSHGLFLEMKDVGKKETSVSDSQKNHIAEAIKQGYQAIVAYGSQDAIEKIKKYLSTDKNENY